jgi:hypothetical protein
MNAWKDIFRVIFNSVKSNLPLVKKPYQIRLGSESFDVNVDQIGELLYSSDSFSHVKFIEEILDVINIYSRLS